MRSLPAASAVPVLIMLLSTGGCSGDVVTTRYRTLAQYEDRGWLPKEVLPPSTRDILTRNNLDTNTSHGHFEFDPGDAAFFLARVRPGPPPWLSDADGSDLVAGFREEGLSAWHYSGADGRLALFCDLDAARCEYRM